MTALRLRFLVVALGAAPVVAVVMVALAAAMVSAAACHAPELADTAAAAVPHKDPIAAVKAAAAEFDRAQLRKDRATIDRYLASDFVFVRGAGVVSDRKAFLAAFTDPETTLEPFEIVNPVAIKLADTAVLIGGETTLRGTERGERFAEHFRYSDVFQLRDGRWQVVYTQVTMMK
jgi:ketosteroid isomerase-like protein